MKNKRIFIALLMTLAFAVPQTGTSYAAGEFAGASEFGGSVLDGVENAFEKTGIVDAKKEIWNRFGLLLKPFIKSRYTYTSNVFKSPDPDKSDSVWEFTPGIQFLKQLSNGVIGGAYEATFRYFSEYDNQNAQDQKFLIYANLSPSENTYLRISESLDQTEYTAGSAGFETIDSTDNTFSVTGGYRMDRFTHELGYENYNEHYSTAIAERFNYNENKFDYRLYYDLMENMRVFTGYRLGLIDYRKYSSRDTTYHEIPAGLEGRLPYDIHARASVGLHHRNLHNGNRNDLTHVVTNISLEKTFNDNRTSVDGGFVRRPVESVFATATTYDEKLWYVGAKHLVTEALRARINTYAGNRDFEERVFTGSRVIVGNRVFVIGGTGGQVKRDDSVYGLNLGFDYSVRKWLIMNVDYQYSRRNSNISQLDYTEQAFSIGTTIPL